MSTVDTASTTQRYGVLGWVIAALFGLLYIYDVWEAVGTMIELPRTYASLGLDAAGIPWWALIVNLLLPVAAFAVAFWVGRRQRAGGKALVFLLGLAVASALSLGLSALVGALSA